MGNGVKYNLTVIYDIHGDATVILVGHYQALPVSRVRDVCFLASRDDVPCM